MEARTEEIRMDAIRIAGRIRKEEGDLSGLAASIRDRGLINPVTVMALTEGGYLLLAGARRISASRMLGQETIRATVLPVIDAEEQLRIEVAENEERKEFSMEEKLNFAAMFTEIEHEKAKQRMAVFGKAGRESYLSGGSSAGEVKGTANWPYPQKGETRNIVSKKAGFTSTTQMRRVKEIAEKRPDLLDKIDSGEMSINAAHREARAVSATPQTELVAAGESPDASDDTQPDSSLGGSEYDGIPTVPGEVLKARMTPEERRRAKEIEASVVKAQGFTLDTEIPDMFRPGDYEAHERLLSEPLYAELYEHDRKAMAAANLIRGELVTKCENYEKRIRAYEENARAMRTRIAQLENMQREVRDDGNR